LRIELALSVEFIALGELASGNVGVHKRAVLDDSLAGSVEALVVSGTSLTVVARSRIVYDERLAQTGCRNAAWSEAIVQIGVIALGSGRRIWKTETSLATSYTKIGITGTGRRFAFGSVGLWKLFALSSGRCARNVHALSAGWAFVGSLAVSGSVANVVVGTSIGVIARSSEGEVASNTAIWVVRKGGVWIWSRIAFLSRFNLSVSTNTLSSFARSALTINIFVRYKTGIFIASKVSARALAENIVQYRLSGAVSGGQSTYTFSGGVLDPRSEARTTCAIGIVDWSVVARKSTRARAVVWIAEVSRVASIVALAVANVLIWNTDFRLWASQ